MSETAGNACYSCGYSLKGLAVADGLFKCPECGSLQTISYTTTPQVGAFDLIHKYPLVWLSPIAVNLVLTGIVWFAPKTILGFMAIVAAALWNVFLPGLYLLISIAMCFFRVPGRMQRAIFFTAWLAVGVACTIGFGLVIRW